jgi:hypothetical protein
MKNPILLFLYCLLPFQALPQSIHGRVQDALGAPLPFATVLLLDAGDSSLVKGTVSGEKGDFRLDKVKVGTYLLTASLIGYTPAHGAAFTVGAADTRVVIPTLLLTQAVLQLQEISVQASKPLFEQQADRLVVNVGSSITAAGATALEVLERSPGVSVNRQTNSLAINGREGVLVMVNGKLRRLPPEALLQMLNGMNATTIEKIELITTPPACFDAEGNAGIINLVLKKNDAYGTSAIPLT